MEAMFGRGREGPPDDEGDKEEGGTVGERNEKRRRNKRASEEGRLHHLGEAAEGSLINLYNSRPFVMPGIFEHGKETEDEDEEDDEEETDKKKKDATPQPQRRNAAQPVESSESETSDDEIAETEDTDASADTAQPEPPQQLEPAREAAHAGKPAWQVEDERKFDEIMEREAPEAVKNLTSQTAEDQEFHRIIEHEAPEVVKEATSRELLGEPGQAPAIERVAKQEVEEPEPVRPVSGYNAEAEQRFAGYTPGQPAEAQAAPPNVPRPPAESGVYPLPEQPGAYGAASRPPVPTGERTGGNAAYYAERRGLRRGLIAGFLTGVVLTRYLKNRKIERLQKEHERQVKKQQDDAERLTAGHQQIQQQSARQQERMAVMQTEQQQVQQHAESQQRTIDELRATQPVPERFEQPSATSPLHRNEAPRPQSQQSAAIERARQAAAAAHTEANAPQEQVDEELAGVTPQVAPHQHIEQDAWRRYVVDEHGHEVHDAMAYGEEYHHERQQELLSGHKPAISRTPRTGGQRQTQDGAAAAMGGAGAPQAPAQPAGAAHDHMIASGQASADHSLPAGMPPADYQHQLPPKERSPIIEALTSPWLFLMLSLILLAYFVASLL